MADPDYRNYGPYDLAKFNALFIEKFGKNPRYNASALSNLSTLVDMIGRDLYISDVRWGAYILATVLWETTSPTKVEVTVKNKRGQPVLKNGKPVTVIQKRWLMTMAPVAEVGEGKGRAYHEAVKVRLLANGTAQITEQDGDQFSVTAAGSITPITKTAKMGTVDGGDAAKVYDDETGTENAYFGRGYVQLTWWSNYIKSGVAIGRGFDLLLEPERVKDPKIAYAIMSHGMRTGFGFANGHKFSNYFSGNSRDYVGARRMVNGTDHAADIAELAEMFEQVLLGSRMLMCSLPSISSEIEGFPGTGPR